MLKIIPLMFALGCSGCIIGIREAAELCKQKGFSPETPEFFECGKSAANFDSAIEHYHEKWVVSHCNQREKFKLENQNCKYQLSKVRYNKKYYQSVGACYEAFISSCLSIVEKSTKNDKKTFEHYCRTMTSKFFFIEENKTKIDSCVASAERQQLSDLVADIRRESAREQKRMQEMREIDRIFSDHNPQIEGGKSGGCKNDFDCSLGSKCIKKQYSTSGFCAVNVNEFGIKNYEEPSIESFGVEFNIQCNFDRECPIGFDCIDNHCIK